jgi:hypothetical protein
MRTSPLVCIVSRGHGLAPIEPATTYRVDKIVLSSISRKFNPMDCSASPLRRSANRTASSSTAVGYAYGPHPRLGGLFTSAGLVGAAMCSACWRIHMTAVVLWVVAIAGSAGSALRSECPPNLHITCSIRPFRRSVVLFSTNRMFGRSTADDGALHCLPYRHRERETPTWRYRDRLL